MTRVAFIEPSLDEYLLLFGGPTARKKYSVGGALNDIEIFTAPPRRALQGSGLFSSLAGLAKRVFPFLVKAIKPSALELGQNVLSDLQTGKSNLRDSLKRRGMEALKSTGRRIVTGSGKRRRRKRRKGRVEKRRKTKQKRMTIKRDVFSL